MLKREVSNLMIEMFHMLKNRQCLAQIIAHQMEHKMEYVILLVELANVIHFIVVKIVVILRILSVLIIVITELFKMEYVI